MRGHEQFFNYGLSGLDQFIIRWGMTMQRGESDQRQLRYNLRRRTLNPAQFQQNLANLFYSPRPPVFVITNQQTGAREFRYYLRPEPQRPAGGQRLVTNWTVSGLVFFIWAPLISRWAIPNGSGCWKRPDTTYGPNNKFLSRYAFIALPAGTRWI